LRLFAFLFLLCDFIYDSYLLISFAITSHVYEYLPIRYYWRLCLLFESVYFCPDFFNNFSIHDHLFPVCFG
jgi:hypothetical protein